MRRAAVVVAGLMLAACSPRVPGAEPFQGVWVSDGWGLVLHVHAAAADVYETSGAFCVLADEATARGIDDRIAREGDRIVLRDADRVVWFDAAPALPAACTADVPDAATLAAAAMREHFHGDLPEGFGGLVGDDGPVLRTLLDGVADPQVALVGDGTIWSPVADADRLALRDALLAGRHPAGAEVGGNGGLVFADLGDGVHYLAPIRLAGFADDPADSQVVLAAAVDRALADARAVILDLRTTTAGAEAEALLVATRFVAEVTTVGRKEARRADGGWAPAGDLVVHPVPGGPFTGRVVVLVGSATAGPSEALVLALRDLPGVTLVGEPTAGSPGTPLARTLPGGWVLGVPNLDVVTPDGMRWAGRPIEPGVAVPLDGAAVVRGEDAALAAALALAGG